MNALKKIRYLKNIKQLSVTQRPNMTKSKRYFWRLSKVSVIVCLDSLYFHVMLSSIRKRLSLWIMILYRQVLIIIVK